MQSLSFIPSKKFGKHHHYELKQTHICIIWPSRALLKKHSFRWLSNTRCHFHWKMYLRLHHHFNLIKEKQWLSISPLTSMALKLVRAPWFQNQAHNLITLLNCRCGNAGNLHTITFWVAVNFTATTKSRLQKQVEVWEDPSPAQLTLPQVELWSQRQTSEVSRINYCRQMNLHAAEI